MRTAFVATTATSTLTAIYIKADSKNALAFEQIVNTWNPEIFLDNHTSDGADYQYVMTLIETQKDKQNPILAEYTSKTLSPEFSL